MKHAERHQRLKAIFSDLCDMPRSQRASTLHQLEMTDPDLAHEVESLLRHSDTPGFDIEDFDQLSPLVADLRMAPADMLRPTRIGQYDIIEELGQGGMGVVYLAQQHTPIKRRVAIKVIRPGMDTRHVLSRFEMERRTLAAMDHPGIASIYDAGVTDAGRPYFVMQHVDGQRITEYCDAHRLSIDERLALFVKVCDAVTHAHQKGVIHRDLKPSNILIEQRDSEANPKVIDFGVAKAMDTDMMQGVTLDTAPGQLLGTPQYMSPEQTQPGAALVDTRSDVYSLGVLLYELLCGMTPLDGEALRSAPFDQVCRLIREQEHMPPSRRIASLGHDEADRIALMRSATRHELVRTLRHELDWITRTATDKEPARRYASAAELALDLERRVRHEPVHAGPVGTAYRMRKFLRRHRGAALASLAVMAALLVGAVAFVHQARQTAHESHNNQLIVKFMDDLFTTADPRKAEGPDLTLREFMDHAGERLRMDPTLPPEVRASLHNTIGSSYAGLGNFTAAEPHVRTAWTLSSQFRGPADVHTLRAAANLIYILDQLEQDEEALAIGHTWLPVAEASLGPLAEETRMILTNLAILLEDNHEFEDAERMYRLAYERDRAAHPDDVLEWLVSLGNLGNFLVLRERIDEGGPMLEECFEVATQALGPTHPRTLYTLGNLAMLRQRQDDYPGARLLCEQLVEGSRAELGPHHPLTLQRVRSLALSCLIQGQFADAEQFVAPVYPSAAARLGSAHPDVIGLSEMLATAVSMQGRVEEAVTLALQMYDGVIAEVPQDHPHARRAARLVAHSYDSWGKSELYNEWLARAGEAPAE